MIDDPMLDAWKTLLIAAALVDLGAWGMIALLVILARRAPIKDIEP